jgi:hypothetical protein
MFGYNTSSLLGGSNKSRVFIPRLHVTAYHREISPSEPLFRFSLVGGGGGRGGEKKEKRAPKIYLISSGSSNDRHTIHSLYPRIEIYCNLWCILISIRHGFVGYATEIIAS